MVPRVEFQNSWIYDQELPRNRRSPKLPRKLVERRILLYSRRWGQVGRRILRELSRVTRLPWRERVIICYVTTLRRRPFSDPLTMPAYRYVENFIDVFTHELIHRLIAARRNEALTRRNRRFLMRRYRRENQLVQTHILVHAIHAHILLTIFGEKRLQKEIAGMQHRRDYRRAWQLVCRDGYQNIIAALSKGL